MCHKSVKISKCLQIFNTAEAPVYASVPIALWYKSRDCNVHCTLPTHQRFLCSNKKTFASIQSLELKHSITRNLDIFKKLDFYKRNQSFSTQNWKTLRAFQIPRGRSHAIGTDGIWIKLSRLKCALHLANPQKISMYPSKISNWNIQSLQT
jgi:hypothetical protein